MKAVSLVLAFLFSSISVFADDAAREAEVVASFLNQANQKDTAISLKLQALRTEKANGFRGENDVIPFVLEKSYIKIVETEKDVYIGKIISPTERESGYEDRSYDIFVPAHETWYGGKIYVMTAIKFTCTFHAPDFESKQVTIECKYIQP